MSFLGSLFNDPKYQSSDPRKAEEIVEADIISPNTQLPNRVPPGQTRTRKWPVLDAHGTPNIDLANWKFEVAGLAERPQQWSLDEFMQLPAVKVYADFHCVTRWQRTKRVTGNRVVTTCAAIPGGKAMEKDFAGPLKGLESAVWSLESRQIRLHRELWRVRAKRN